MKENLKSIGQTISENPDLPFYAVYKKDKGYKEHGKAEVVEFFQRGSYEFLRTDDTEKIFDAFFSYKNCGITKDTPEEEVDRIRQEKVDGLAWKKAIIAYI